MEKLTGKILDMSLDLKTGKAKLMLELNEKQSALNVYESLNQEEKLSIDIKKYRNKRSLDANAYFWVLADKLAEHHNISKEEVYLTNIRDIGGNTETVCVKNNTVDKLCKTWRENGLGWITETFPSKIEGCTNVTLYFGSSTFDSSQMSRLISNIVQDCQAVGIETKTPEEIDSLLSLWKDGA